VRYSLLPIHLTISFPYRVEGTSFWGGTVPGRDDVVRRGVLRLVAVTSVDSGKDAIPPGYSWSIGSRYISRPSKPSERPEPDIGSPMTAALVSLCNHPGRCQNPFSGSHAASVSELIAWSFQCWCKAVSIQLPVDVILDRGQAGVSSSGI
jgi:hypothetical protein